MTAYQSLVEFVGKRTDRQQAQFRNLVNQCDGAKLKLVQLRNHAERYRQQMQNNLADGMDAAATMAFLRFIGQIEVVVAKQEAEIVRLESACAELLRSLVESRREKRMYEILRDRSEAEKLELAIRRAQAEMDDLMGRIVKLL